MEHKDLASILAGPSLTPEQAYNRATPAQRRAWFGDEPPTKAASQYDLPPAQPVGLPPELEAAVQAHRLSHYADPICPRCRLESKDGNARGGRCPHRPSPAQAAQQRAWQRTADQTVLFQQAQQRKGGYALVVDWRRETSVMALRSELLALLDAI
jgi:hypothetical protein